MTDGFESARNKVAKSMEFMVKTAKESFEKPSKDFSWLIVFYDIEGRVHLVDASEGFHDTDWLGYGSTEGFCEDMLQGFDDISVSSVVKIATTLEVSTDWETGMIDDCWVEQQDTIEVLWEYKG